LGDRFGRRKHRFTLAGASPFSSLARGHKQEVAEMINYKQWEQHEKLSIAEAACLWNEVSPYRYQNDKLTDQENDVVYEKIRHIIKQAEKFSRLDYIKLNHPEIVDGIDLRWKNSCDNKIDGLVVTDPYRTKFEENIFRAAEKSVRDENINSKTLFYWSYYYRIANSIKEKPLFLYPQGSLAYSDFENYKLFEKLIHKIIKRDSKNHYRFFFVDSIKNEENLKKRLYEIKGIKEKEKELVLNLWKKNKSKEQEQKADLSRKQDTNQTKETFSSKKEVDKSNDIGIKKVKLEINENSYRWYVNTKLILEKRKSRIRFNFIKTLYDQIGFRWIKHDVFMNMFNWKDLTGYHGSFGKTGKMGKLVSEMRKKLGVDILYDKKLGVCFSDNVVKSD